MRIYIIIAIWLFAFCNVWCNNPFVDSIYITKGDSCVQQYDMFSAISYYKLSENADKNINIIRKVAECYRKIGNYKFCISWLQKIDSTNISHTDMRSLYYSYRSLDQRDSILYWGTKLTNLFPFDGEIVASLSAYFNDNNNSAKADSLARAYCKHDSTNILVNRQLGYACYSLKKYNEALYIYRKLIDKGFDNYESNYILGTCYEQTDSIELAYKYLIRAAMFSRNKDFNSLYHLGVLNLNQGDATESLEYFKKARDVIQPDKKTLFNLHKNMGASYFKLRRYEEAGCAFEVCLNYYPKDILTFYNAAQMFYAAGKVDKAKDYLSKFIESYEQNQDVSENLSQLIENAKQQLQKW